MSHEKDFVVFQIARHGVDRLHVDLAAATAMSFGVTTAGHDDYDTLITDICQIAPIMMRYDADLAEAYDDAFRTQPKVEDRRAISLFVRKYRSRIRDAQVGFDEFAGLGGL